MSFKTQKEIYEALLNGKKIKHATGIIGTYIHLSDGNLVDKYGTLADPAFLLTHEWSLYEEPKKMKTVTLYRYTYQLGLHFYRTAWSSEVFIANNMARLVKTETETIEIEDV